MIESTVSTSDSDDCKALLGEAEILMSYGKFERAIEVLSIYLRAFPEDPKALGILQECQAKLSKNTDHRNEELNPQARLEIPGLEYLDSLKQRIGAVAQGAVASLSLGAFAILLTILFGIDAMLPATFELPSDIIGQVYTEMSTGGMNDSFVSVFNELIEMIGGTFGKIAAVGMITVGVMQGITRQNMMSFVVSVVAGVSIVQMPTIMQVLLETESGGVHAAQVLASEQPPYVLAQKYVKSGNPDRAREYLDELVSTSYQGVKDFNAQVATALELAVYQTARSAVAIATVKAAAESDDNSERIATISGMLGALLFLVSMAATTLRRLIVNNVKSIEEDIEYLLQASEKRGVQW